MKCRSEWQRPATLVRIRTSRGPGFGTLTSSITSGLLTSYRTAAFMVVSPVCFFRVCSAASLRGGEQFANLGHAGGALAKQLRRDGALRSAFRQPERIARRNAMVDHHPRQQEAARIAAHLVDAAAFPGKGYRAGDMIEQAGGAPRVAFIVHLACHFAREA